MNAFSHVPPGFRFHPTDEELVDFYLRRKVTSRRFDLDVIKEVDLYKIEPWDLQELCKIGSTEEQSDWYFFSHKDKKYPTGTRTNRATTAGFWKATGRDKAIYSKHDLIGMRKTLVFYKGRAPNGQKSEWIMHEYRLETDENGTPQEEGWVVCRVFKKKIATNMRRGSEHESPCWYDGQVSFMPDLESPKQNSNSHLANNYQLPYPCKKELDHHLPYQVPQEHFLPLLESPKLLQSATTMNSTTSSMAAYSLVLNQATALQSSSLRQEEQIQPSHDQNFHAVLHSNNCNNVQAVEDHDQLTDWRVLDKFVASQLSQEDVSKKNSYSGPAPNNCLNASNNPNVVVRHWEKQDLVPENASSSTSCQIEPWKCTYLN